MIRLNYDKSGKILGAYADNDKAPKPNIVVADDAWLEFDTVKNGKLVHNEIPLDVAQLERHRLMTKSLVLDLSIGFLCPTSQISMDCTASSISILSAAYDKEVSRSSATMNIRDYDNVTHPGMAISDVGIMIDELYLHAKERLEHKWSKQDLIREAATVTEVNSVNWR